MPSAGSTCERPPVPVGLRAGRPRVHAEGERVAHPLLARHDPGLRVTHWINSVTYVAALSLWALVSGHWSAWQAARVEVNQQQEAEQRERADVPGQIVERMVQETTIAAEPALVPAKETAGD